jgi:hypothetical protein
MMPGADQYRLADVPPSLAAPNVHKAMRSEVNLSPDMATIAAPLASQGANGAAAAGSPVVAAQPKFTAVSGEDEAREAEHEEEPSWLSAQGLVLVAAIAALIFGTWYFLQPPSLDKLYARAIAANENDSLAEAEADIQAFLNRADPSDPRSQELDEMRDRIEVDRLERQLDRRSRLRGKTQGLSPVERDYVEALKQVDLDPELGMKKMMALVDLYGGDTSDQPGVTRQCLELAKRKLEKLREDVAAYSREYRERISAQLDRADAIAGDDPLAAQKIWRAVIELYDGKTWATDLVDQARAKLEDRTADSRRAESKVKSEK